jgi:hypothetical protein
MTTTSVNRSSRKELVALGTAITFVYVGAYGSAFLAFYYSGLNHIFEVFWWIGGVCWFLAMILPARLGRLLAKKRGWNGEVGALLGVIPWIVITGLAILMVAMIVSSLG